MQIWLKSMMRYLINKCDGHNENIYTIGGGLTAAKIHKQPSSFFQ